MFLIDCQHINSFDDFVEEFNKGMIRSVGGEWNGNLDAFNDYLSWPASAPYRLTILGAEKCKKVLNFKISASHTKVLWAMIEEILNDNQDVAIVEFK